MNDNDITFNLTLYGNNHDVVDGFVKRKFIEAIKIFTLLIIQFVFRSSYFKWMED